MISSKDENVCHNVWSSLAFQNASGYPNISVVKRISDEDFRSYRNRIEVLAEIGAEDDIALCRESEADFWYFTNPSLCTAGLVLTHDGNLRAVWKGKDKSRIGVEFQGGKVSRYVIFKYYSDGKPTRRVAGTVALDQLREKIRELDLEHLIYG